MTELDQLVRSLARAFDNAGSTSKTALRKVLQDHIRRLHALRAIAKDAEVESFYTVAAWYLTKPYLLKQDCVSKQDFAAEDLVIIDESRRVKAINTLNQAWGAKAIDTIRKHLRDPLPLPTIPARDFLEALVKIATKVTLNKFLQYFPDFVSDRLDTWRTEPQFYSQELQPCLQFRHINTFYKEWYAPRILQHGAIEHPSKRQRTSADQRCTRASACTRTALRDDEVELPRRTSLPDLVGEDTVIQETSPAPNPSTNSTQQRTEGLARYSNVSAGSRDGISPNNTITEDSDLQLDIGHSFVDEGLQQDTLGGQDDPTSNEAANSVDTSSADSPMARRRAPSLGEIRSTKLVQGKFDDLEQNGGMVHAFEVIKWCIESAKELEQLKAGKAAAKEALTTAENELQELEEHISEQLSAGKTLDEATRDLETDIKRLETLIDRLTAIQHEVAEEIAPGLANFDIQGSTDLASFDSTLTSANTAKTGKEHKLEELEQLAEQLNTKEEDRQNKAEEAERLDSEYVKLTNIMQDVKRFVELVPSDSAAMAKLTP